MKFLTISILLFLLSSCASTFLVNSTKINEFTILDKQDKVMIISMFKNKNIRGHFETQMLIDLSEYGIKSETSLYTFIRTGEGKEIPKEKVEEYIRNFKNKGFNKILLTVLVDKEQHSEFQRTGVSLVSPSYNNTYYNDYYGYPYGNNYTGNLYGYIGAYQPYFYSNSKITEIQHKSYICESTLYDISTTDPNLIWVGTFKANDVSSTIDAIDQYTKEVVEELVTVKK